MFTTFEICEALWGCGFRESWDFSGLWFGEFKGLGPSSGFREVGSGRFQAPSIKGVGSVLLFYKCCRWVRSKKVYKYRGLDGLYRGFRRFLSHEALRSIPVIPI